MDIKAGWKTTEFWMALAAAIVGAMMTAGVFADGSTGAKLIGVAAIVLSSFGYSVSRGMAKSGQNAGADREIGGPGGPVGPGTPSLNLVPFVLFVAIAGMLGGCQSTDNASTYYARAATSERLCLQAVVTYEQVATATSVPASQKTAVLRTAKLGTDALAALTDSLKAASDAYQSAKASGNAAAMAEANDRAKITYAGIDAVASQLMASLTAQAATGSTTKPTQ